MSDDYEAVRHRFAWQQPDRYNLGAALCRGPADRRERVAIIIAEPEGRDRRYTFGYLDDCSNRLANLLVRGKHCAGERVAVMLQPSVQAAICYLAILKAGLIAVLLPASPRDAFSGRLEAAGASGILTSTTLAGAHRAEWSRLSGVRTVMTVSDDRPIDGAKFLDNQLANESSDFPAVATKPGDPALLVFEMPPGEPLKGVLHAHGVVSGLLPALLFTKTPLPDDVCWSSFDWGWLGGLLIPFGAWHCGAAVLIQPTVNPSTAGIAALLRHFEVTRLSISPQILAALRKETGSAGMPPLTSVTVGGGAVDHETREWLRAEAGVELSELYGSNECPAVFGQGSLVTPCEGSLGKPAPGQQVEILFDDGQVAPQGAIGRIAVKWRHPGMFLEYWQDERASHASRCGDYFLTNDRGFEDDQGYFWYVSNADGSIRTGRRKIGLANLERAIVEHSGISRCAAVGLPDQTLGEAVVLWLELVPGAAASSEVEDHVVNVAREHLGDQLMPRRVRIVGQIPTTHSGEVHRGEVRRAEIALFNAAHRTKH